ncbi:hypothetical protein CALCODRAFT_557010 [Calocera cornea HHB12733]|uniref:C2H2-type domain-containing protein n=1 Tax=Calocera cornea HHB12733 TaxID=1353952 RepID=A0A165E8R0_9BASI|nr:hypothetical protein CALCODRAFT_557010 [Calocera cornea HHB12733]
MDPEHQGQRFPGNAIRPSNPLQTGGPSSSSEHVHPTQHVPVMISMGRQPEFSSGGVHYASSVDPLSVHHQQYSAVVQPVTQNSSHATTSVFRPSSHLRQTVDASWQLSTVQLPHQLADYRRFSTVDPSWVNAAVDMEHSNDSSNRQYSTVDQSDEYATSLWLQAGIDPLVLKLLSDPFSSLSIPLSGHGPNSTLVQGSNGITGTDEKRLTPSGSSDIIPDTRASSVAPSLPDSLCDPDYSPFASLENSQYYSTSESTSSRSPNEAYWPQQQQQGQQQQRVVPTPRRQQLLTGGTSLTSFLFRIPHDFTQGYEQPGSLIPWQRADLDNEGKLLPYEDGSHWVPEYCERLQRIFTNEFDHRAFHEADHELTKEEMQANVLQIGPRQFKCGWECCSHVLSGISFGRAFELERHMRSTHSGMRHQCPYCQKQYARHDLVLRHCETAHAGRKAAARMGTKATPASAGQKAPQRSRAASAPRKRGSPGSSSAVGKGSSGGSNKRGGWADPESDDEAYVPSPSVMRSSTATRAPFLRSQTSRT